jgi:hypothetical protein
VDYTSRQVTVAADATLVGAAGAIVGALIGHAGKETWLPVGLASRERRVGLSLGRTRDGTRLVMSIGL